MVSGVGHDKDFFLAFFNTSGPLTSNFLAKAGALRGGPAPNLSRLSANKKRGSIVFFAEERGTWMALT